MIITTDILNKNGAPGRSADNNPIPFLVECEIDYTIDEGQTGIYDRAPENCQPYYAPEADVHLLSAKILYGNYDYHISNDSVWWSVVEDRLNGSETITDKIIEYENERQNPWC